MDWGPGVDIYISWSWEDEAKKAKPEEILGRFERHLAPKMDFRIAMYQSQHYRQKINESLDDYITRCRNQAAKCKLRYVKELGERLIEQLIIGTKHRRVQGKLLENNEVLCLDDAIDIAGNYEITHSNLEQLLSPVDQDVHLIKQSRYERQSRKACNNCGKKHPDDSRNRCPAWGTTCKRCGKPNHWTRICRSRSQGNPKQYEREIYKPQNQPRQWQENKRGAKNYEISKSLDNKSDEEFENIIFESIMVGNIGHIIGKSQKQLKTTWHSWNTV